jgi:hypothetical protein
MRTREDVSGQANTLMQQGLTVPTDAGYDPVLRSLVALNLEVLLDIRDLVNLGAGQTASLYPLVSSIAKQLEVTSSRP